MVGRATVDARAAFESHEWTTTYRLLSEPPVDDLSVEDLDRLATAAYLTGRDETAFALWARGHQDCAERGEVELSARHGIRLAQTLGFKGDIARGAGWVERVRRMLDEGGVDCVERGHLAHATAMCRIFQADDLAGARTCSSKPARSARPTAIGSWSPWPGSVRAGCSSTSASA